MITKKNGKPVVTSKPPFWRHHIFPWGWYQLGAQELEVGDIIEADGHYSPGDGGGNMYEVVQGGTGIPDGGSFIDLDNGLQKKSILSSASNNQWGG